MTFAITLSGCIDANNLGRDPTPEERADATDFLHGELDAFIEKLRAKGLAVSVTEFWALDRRYTVKEPTA